MIIYANPSPTDRRELLQLKSTAQDDAVSPDSPLASGERANHMITATFARMLEACWQVLVRSLHELLPWMELNGPATGSLVMLTKFKNLWD